MKKRTSLFLCIALTATMALSTAGCSDNTKNGVSSSPTSNAGSASDTTVLGKGSTNFAFTVTDQDGNSTQFEIHTDREMVGEALLELDLIAGDTSEYGLYVKTVNNITVDYDQDGKYWAFYIDGEYALTGVDSTPITDGTTYSFKIE